MGDFSTKQPKPQPASATEFFDGDDAEVPVTGFTEAPSSELAQFGPGPGIAPNQSKIH